MDSAMNLTNLTANMDSGTLDIQNEDGFVVAAGTLLSLVSQSDDFSHLLASTILIGLLARFVYRVVTGYARICLVLILLLLASLGVQTFYLEQSSPIESSKEQLKVATQATLQLAKDCKNTLVLWLNFFLPLSLPLAHHYGGLAIELWGAQALETRVHISIAMAVFFLLVFAFRMHGDFVLKTSTKLTFHTAFVPLAYLLWYVSGFIPENRLETCLKLVITWGPFLATFIVLSVALRNRARRSNNERPVLKRENSTFASAPLTNLQWQKTLLAYWACWPVLRLMLPLIAALPAQFPGINNRLPSILQRVLIIFVIFFWCWGGYVGRALLKHLMALFSLDRVADFVQTSMLSLVSIPQAGGMQAVQSIYSNIGSPTGKGPILVGAFVILLIVYNVFSALVVGLDFLLYFLAAADTAQDMSEDIYEKKLSFWVIVMLWRALMKIPVLAIVLRPFTLLVAIVAFIWGEKVLQLLVLLLGRTVAHGHTD